MKAGGLMSSVSIIRRKTPYKDGSYAIAIQIIKDRRKSLVTIGRVDADDWDDDKKEVRRCNPNHQRLNNLFRKKLAEATDNALDIETKKPEATSKAIRQKIKPRVGVSFFAQADEYLKVKEAENYNIYASEKPRLKHFRDFLQGQDLAFSDLTLGLLQRFETWLKTVYKPKGKKKKRLGERSVVNHFVTIRSVFAFARDQGAVDEKMTPFGKKGFKIVFPETTKIGLSKAEVIALENTEMADPRHEHARKLWLFLFYFAGMRVSDAFRLKWSDFHDGRLYYKMGKNGKVGSLKVPEQAARILKYYEQFKETKGDLVFPELKGVDLSDQYVTKRTIGFKISAIDKFLQEYVAPAAGIEKSLTLHIARHTFATLAGGAVDIQKLQKLYRHSDVKTTINYQQNFIHEDADDALDAVINKVRSKPKPE
ncbi:MAG: site-specific integrase [Niastella sp.]|nr:site-specific integrase [Niastella sp.]